MIFQENGNYRKLREARKERMEVQYYPITDRHIFVKANLRMHKKMFWNHVVSNVRPEHLVWKCLLNGVALYSYCEENKSKWKKLSFSILFLCSRRKQMWQSFICGSSFKFFFTSTFCLFPCATAKVFKTIFAFFILNTICKQVWV